MTNVTEAFAPAITFGPDSEQPRSGVSKDQPGQTQTDTDTNFLDGQFGSDRSQTILAYTGQPIPQEDPMKKKLAVIALILAPILAACQSTGSGPAPELPNPEDRRGY